LFSVYLPKGSAFSEGALQLKAAVKDKDWGDIQAIGATEAWGVAHIGDTDHPFTTEGEYEVYHFKLTAVSDGSENASTAANSAAITTAKHIQLGLTVKWVTYSGKIAFKFDKVQARQ
jgi:hypothetical protein